MRMHSKVRNEITTFPLGKWIQVYTYIFVVILGFLLRVCCPSQEILTNG
jgi:hypothetical protein